MELTSKDATPLSKDSEYLIALGANLSSPAGVPELTLRAAINRLARSGARGMRVSRFFRTPCFPPGAGPDYVNAAARLRLDGGPRRMLDLLHAVEDEFGRKRVWRWGQRTLDLDLLAAGGQVAPDRATHDRWRELPPESRIAHTPDRLILPHPRLQDRAFVLVPLADVAPQWRHPVLAVTVREMLAALPPGALAEVVPLPG